MFHHRSEDLHQDDQQREGCGTFGNDGEVGGHCRRSTLIGIGGPQVERHEGELEAQSGKEEHQGEDLHRGAFEHGRDVVEVERAHSSVDERDAVEHQTRREHGVHDVFGSGFSRFVFVFVHCHEAGHRDRC